MAILNIVELVLSLLVTVTPTILAYLKERHDVKKPAFDLGLSELHIADDRMQLQAHQHEPPTMQSS